MTCADNTCFLSVIIPAYNSECTIRKTVCSVLNAQIDGMEILLIDDGSTDSTPSICDKLAEQHECISVIHQENKGLSDARNVGLSFAKGTYVFFLDGDDTVNPDLFQQFINYTNEHLSMPDVVGFDAQKCHSITGEKSPIGNPISASVIDGKDGTLAIKAILEADPHYEWYAWKYIFSTRYLKKNELSFLSGKYYEDVEWTPRVLLGASSVGYMNILGVNYLYQNPTSILNVPSLKRSLDKIEVAARMIRYTEKTVTDRVLAALLKTNFSKLYVSALGDYCNGTRALYASLRKHADILRYTDTTFGSFSRKVCRLFGFRAGSILIKAAVRFKKVCR